MPTTLSAAVLLSDDTRIPDPLITLDNQGTILSIETGPGDPDGSIVAPASFDIHIHGAANCDVMQASPNALASIGGFLASRGIGHFLPTTVTAPLDLTLHALDRLASLIESPGSQTQQPHP